MPKRKIEVNDLTAWKEPHSWESWRFQVWTTWEYWALGCHDGGVASWQSDAKSILHVLEIKTFIYPQDDYPPEDVARVFDLKANQVGWVETRYLKKWTQKKARG